jgi:hypothetical protein
VEQRVEIPTPSTPRFVAILLAAGGTFWGLFLLAGFGPAALIPLPFGIGYLVTVGYIVRSVMVPPLGVRYLIWGASILVQGAWLLWIVSDMAKRVAAGRQVFEPPLIIAWWAFATISSVVAIVCERRGGPAEPNCAPGPSP